MAEELIPEVVPTETVTPEVEVPTTEVVTEDIPKVQGTAAVAPVEEVKSVDTAIPETTIEPAVAAVAPTPTGPDNIDEFYTDIIKPNNYFGSAEEFRTFISNPENAKEFYNDVLSSKNYFPNADEFVNFIGVPEQGKQTAGQMKTELSSQIAGRSASKSLGGESKPPSGVQRNKLGGLRVPKNLYTIKADSFQDPKIIRQTLSKLGISMSDFTSDDIAVVLEKEYKSAGDMVEDIAQTVMDRQANPEVEQPEEIDGSFKRTFKTVQTKKPLVLAPKTFDEQYGLKTAVSGIVERSKDYKPSSSTLLATYERDQQKVIDINRQVRDNDKKINDLKTGYSARTLGITPTAEIAKIQAENEQLKKTQYKLTNISNQSLANAQPVLNKYITGLTDGLKFKNYLNDDGTLKTYDINKAAVKIAEDAGLSDEGVVVKYVEGLIGARAKANELKPAAEGIFEGERQKILKQYGIDKKNLEDAYTIPIDIKNQTALSVKTVGDEINVFATREGDLASEEYKKTIDQNDADYLAAMKSYSEEIELQKELYKQNQIPFEEAEARINEIVAQSELDLQAYDQFNIDQFGNYQIQLNEINSKYNAQYKRKQQEIYASADKLLKEDFDKYVKKSGFDKKSDEVNEKLKKAYSDAWDLAFKNQDNQKFIKTEKLRQDAGFFDFLKGVSGGTLGKSATLELLFTSYNNSFGSSVEALGEGLGLDWMRKGGKYIKESSDVLAPARTESWSDILDFGNFTQLSGQLGGSMTPSILATAGLTAAAGSAGLGMGAQMVAGALSGWAVESADMANRLYLDTISSTGNAALAQDRSDKMWDFQTKMMWTYSLESLPFMGDFWKGLKIFSKSPRLSLASKIVAGGLTEYGTEMGLQEYPQGLGEEAIMNNRDAMTYIGEQVSKVRKYVFGNGIYASDTEKKEVEAAYKGFKETAIVTGPTFGFGAAGATRGALREYNEKASIKKEGLAYYQKYVVGQAAPHTQDQQIRRLTMVKGASFAGTMISNLFSAGQLTLEQRDNLLATVDKTKTYLQNAATQKLDSAQTGVYMTLAGLHENALAQVAVTEDPIMQEAAQKKADALKKELTDYLVNKETNLIHISLANGESYLVTTDDLRLMLETNPDLIGDIADGNFEYNPIGKSETKLQKELFGGIQQRVEEYNSRTEEENKAVPLTEEEVKLKTDLETLIAEDEKLINETGEGQLTPEERQQAEEKVTELTKKQELYANKEAKQQQQEGDAAINSEEYQGTQEGQPEVGQSQGGERSTTERQADSGNRNTTGEVQNVQEVTDNIAQLRADEQAEYEALADPNDKAARDEIYERYNELITPLLKQEEELKAQASEAEAEPAPTPESQRPSQTLNPKNVDRAIAEEQDKSPKIVKILNDAKKVLKTLGKFGVTVNVHHNPAEYRQAVIDGGGTEAQANAKTRGFFLDSNGQIHINVSLNSSDTVMHEGAHPLLEYLIAKNPQAVDDLYKQLEMISNFNEGARLAIQFGKSTTDTAEQGKKEAIVQFIASIANGDIDLSSYSPSRITQIKEFIKDFLAKLGLTFDVNITDKDSIVEVARKFTDALNKGREVTVGAKPKKGVAQEETQAETQETVETPQFMNNYIDENSNMEYRYDKNSSKFKQLEKNGRNPQLLETKGGITKNLSIKDFNGQTIFFHQPDAAFAGAIYKNGQLLVQGKGGLYYPIVFHKDGFFWASTDKAARTMARKLNEVFKANGGKILMALTTAPYDKLLSSTTAANAVMDLFISKAFDDDFSISKEQVTQSLIDAANKSAIKKILETYTKADEKLNPENEEGEPKLDENGKKQYKDKVVGLRLGLSPDATLEDIKSKISKKLAATESSFGDRKMFAEALISNMADIIKRNPEATKQFNQFFREGLQNKRFIGTPIPKSTDLKISATNMGQAISEMLTEPMLRDEIDREKGGKIYAILELNAEVKPVDSLKHESYPKALESVDKNVKVKLHILKDRVQWSDVVIDPKTNKLVQQKRFKKVYPTSGVSTTGLVVDTKNVPDATGKKRKGPQFQAVEGFEGVVNGFYSNTENALSQVKQEKMSGNQWITQLLSRGANKEEMQITGLEQLLKDNQSKPLTKTEIGQFLKDNKIRVEEIVKGAGQGFTIDEVDDAYNSINRELSSITNQPQEIIDNASEFLEEWYSNPSNANLKYLGGALYEVGLNLDDFIEDAQERMDTSFSRYQLEGEKENYKEVLVTLPNKQTKYFVVSEDGEEFSYPTRERAENNLFRGNRIEERLVDSGFKSPHFEEKNILVHLRMNTRIDADGNKVLLLEEIQSDWGQAGKKQGFEKLANIPLINQLEKEKQNVLNSSKSYSLLNEKTEGNLSKYVFDAIQQQATKMIDNQYSTDESKKETFLTDIERVLNYWSRNDEYSVPEMTQEELSNFYDIYIQELKDNSVKMRGSDRSFRLASVENKIEEIDNKIFDAREKEGVVSGPFVTDTNAWAKLGLKVALKEAIKQGVDKIAWTTGTQQFDRWGTEKIDWEKVTPLTKEEDARMNELGQKIMNYSDTIEERLEFNKLAERSGDSKDGMWNLNIQEQWKGTAFEGMNIDKKALNRNGVKINSKNDLKNAIDRTLDREKTESEREKLADRVWKRMQNEDSGTSLPRKEGMENFYGSPTEGNLGILGNVAKSLFKQTPETTKITLSRRDQSIDPFNDFISKMKEKYGETGWISKLNEYEKRKWQSVAEYEAPLQTSTQASIDITPELKAQVNKGLPQFQAVEETPQFQGTDDSNLYGNEKIRAVNERVAQRFEAEGRDVEAAIMRETGAYRERKQIPVFNAAQAIVADLGSVEAAIEYARDYTVPGDIRTAIFGINVKQKYVAQQADDSTANTIALTQALDLFAVNSTDLGQAVSMIKQVYSEIPELFLKLNEVINTAQIANQLGDINIPGTTANGVREVGEAAANVRKSFINNVIDFYAGNFNAENFFGKGVKSLTDRARRALNQLTTIKNNVNDESKKMLGELLKDITDRGIFALGETSEQARRYIRENLDKLNATLAEDRKMTDAQINDFTNALADLYEEVAEDQITKAANRILGNPTTKVEVARTNKAVRAVMYGALTDAALLNKFAQKFGLLTITPALQANLTNLARQWTNAKGAVAKAVALNRFNKAMQRAVLNSQSGIAKAYGYFSLGGWLFEAMYYNTLLFAINTFDRAAQGNIQKTVGRMAFSLLRGDADMIGSSVSDTFQSRDFQYEYVDEFGNTINTSATLNETLDNIYSSLRGLPRLSEIKRSGLNDVEQLIRESKSVTQRRLARTFLAPATRVMSAIDSLTTPINETLTKKQAYYEFIKDAYKAANISVPRSFIVAQVNQIVGADIDTVKRAMGMARVDIVSGQLFADLGFTNPNQFPDSDPRKSSPLSKEAKVYNEWIQRVYEILDEEETSRLEKVAAANSWLGTIDPTGISKTINNYASKVTSEMTFLGVPRGSLAGAAVAIGNLSNNYPALKYIGVTPLFVNASMNAVSLLVKITPGFNLVQYLKYLRTGSRGSWKLISPENAKKEYDIPAVVRLDQQQMLTTVIATTGVMVTALGLLSSIYKGNDDEEERAIIDHTWTGLTNVKLTPLQEKYGYQPGKFYYKGKIKLDYKDSGYMPLFSAIAFLSNKDIWSNNPMSDKFFVEKPQEDLMDQIGNYVLWSVATMGETSTLRDMSKTTYDLMALMQPQTDEEDATTTKDKLWKIFENKMANTARIVIPYARLQQEGKGIYDALTGANKKIGFGFAEKLSQGMIWEDWVLNSNNTDYFGRPIKETFKLVNPIMSSHILGDLFEGDQYTELMMKFNYAPKNSLNQLIPVTVNADDMDGRGSLGLKELYKKMKNASEREDATIRNVKIDTEKSVEGREGKSVTYSMFLEPQEAHMINQKKGEFAFGVIKDNMNGLSGMEKEDFHDLMNLVYSIGRNVAIYQNMPELIENDRAGWYQRIRNQINDFEAKTSLYPGVNWPLEYSPAKLIGETPELPINKK